MAFSDSRGGDAEGRLRDAGRRLAALARTAVRAVLESTEVDAPEVLLSAFPYQAGVFVTIRRTTGELRGCVGSVRPTRDCVAREVLRVAPLAAFKDHRFSPVALDELSGLRFYISVLTPPEPCDDVAQLDPSRYGVSITDPSGRRALLLPEIPGITTVAQQLSEVRQKAQIEPDAPIAIARFETLKFSE